MSWLDAELNEIRSRDDLARYLQGLAQRLRSGALQLENPETVDFVDASARWTKPQSTGFLGCFLGAATRKVPSELG
jgi:hypothetical protein